MYTVTKVMLCCNYSRSACTSYRANNNTKQSYDTYLFLATNMANAAEYFRDLSLRIAGEQNTTAATLMGHLTFLAHLFLGVFELAAVTVADSVGKAILGLFSVT